MENSKGDRVNAHNAKPYTPATAQTAFRFEVWISGVGIGQKLILDKNGANTYILIIPKRKNVP